MQHRTRRDLILGFIGIVVGLALASTVVVLAGNLDPSDPPASTSFYSLQDLYNRLDTGAAGAPSTFTEPTSGPGSTMPTLNEIMAVAPTTHTRAATQTQILSGTVAWGLSEGAWGVITGTRPYAPVPKTGQTTVYSPTDDGDLQVGVAWPNPRFTDNDDGTVKDNLTGLVWLKDANCLQGHEDWSGALTFASSLYDGWTGDGSGGDCGLSDSSSAGDWRVPTVQELQSLIHWGYYSPALPNTAGTGQWAAGDPFTNVWTDYYWSSTTYADDASYGWAVDLLDGSVPNHAKVNGASVWPIRDRK